MIRTKPEASWYALAVSTATTAACTPSDAGFSRTRRTRCEMDRLTRLELDMARRRCFAKGFTDGLRGHPADGAIVGVDYVACYDAGLRFGKFTRVLASAA